MCAVHRSLSMVSPAKRFRRKSVCRRVEHVGVDGDAIVKRLNQLESKIESSIGLNQGLRCTYNYRLIESKPMGCQGADM